MRMTLGKSPVRAYQRRLSGGAAGGAGPIGVAVGFADGQTSQLRFSDQADVEFPGEGDRLDGATPMPRNALTVVVERKGRAAVRSMQAHDQRGPGGH
jgi:hypothetical protein